MKIQLVGVTVIGALAVGAAAAVFYNIARAQPLAIVPCEGLFGPQANVADLIKTFGEDHVRSGRSRLNKDEFSTTITMPDGGPLIEIFWRKADLTQPGLVTIGNFPGINPKSNLATVPVPNSSMTVAGVAFGTSLANVETMNGRPFSMAKFPTDPVLEVLSWNGGVLKNKKCELTMNFQSTENVGHLPYEFMSDNDAVRAVEPHVSGFSFGHVGPY